MKDIASYLDTLAKLQAKYGMPSGGTQYKMEVALGPSASAKNQAMMRVAKTKPMQTLPLRELAKCQ